MCDSMIAIDVFTSCRTYTVFIQAEKKLKLGLGKGAPSR